MEFLEVVLKLSLPPHVPDSGYPTVPVFPSPPQAPSPPVPDTHAPGLLSDGFGDLHGNFMRQAQTQKSTSLNDDVTKLLLKRAA